MQVIFTKWHVITLDVVPFLINIFLQKKKLMRHDFHLADFRYINIIGNISGLPRGLAVSLCCILFSVTAEANVAVVSLHNIIFTRLIFQSLFSGNVQRFLAFTDFKNEFNF